MAKTEGKVQLEKKSSFATSLRQAAAKAPKVKLAAADLKALAASRKARARGEKGLSVTEAMKVIRGS